MAKTILVAEDDSVVRALLVDLLTEAGYEVRCASNGEEAFDALEREPADLILSDIMMPQLDGISLVIRLRSRGERVPIILMSAFLREPPLASVRLVTKPFDLDQLFATITAAFNGAAASNGHDRNGEHATVGSPTALASR